MDLRTFIVSKKNLLNFTHILKREIKNLIIFIE